MRILKTKGTNKNELHDYYNSKINSRYDKNRSHYTFMLSAANKQFILDACRLLNVFHKCKTFNEDSLFSFNKNHETGKANMFAHPVVFTKYIMWCFPDKYDDAQQIMLNYVTKDLNEDLKEYITWISKNYEKCYQDYIFDPVTFLKEITLVKKFVYPDNEDLNIIKEVITLNKSMIEVGIEFKERMLITTKFFNK